MRVLCATVVAAAMIVAAPMQVLASETAKAPNAAAPTTIAAAAARAAQTASSGVPAPRPYEGRDRSRKQGGGGKTGMVIGLASALIGTAATIYMVKQMKDSTKQASNPQ